MIATAAPASVSGADERAGALATLRRPWPRRRLGWRGSLARLGLELTQSVQDRVELLLDAVELRALPSAS
jgi:hypothetical protein